MRLATPQPRPHMVLPAVVIIPSVQVVVLPGQKVAVPATSGQIFKSAVWGLAILDQHERNYWIGLEKDINCYRFLFF
jgi:hypothetical protein